MTKRILFILSILFIPSCQWLPEVGKVSLSESSVALKVGGSRTLTATVEPAAAEYEGIIWHTSDPSVVLVSNGRIVAEKVGSATITASAAGVTSSPCQVTVSKTPVSNVSLNKSSVSILEGESLALKVTVSPSDATNGSVTWSTGNSKVAIVSSSGTITAVEEGETTITAKSADSGIIATCRVVVTAEYVDFPDPNFRKYMVENFDLNKNGKISLTEAVKVTTIEVNTDNIESLDGIEYCTSLLRLVCDGSFSYSNNRSNGLLKSLNVSKNSSLQSLSCCDNQLTTLDISGNNALTFLNCNRNRLPDLNVSKNVALTQLYCNSNQLTALNVSNNVALTHLSCYVNQLATLDVSRNTALIYLDCHANQLTSLDVSRNTALTHLGCYFNQLTSLNVSKNTTLISLGCGINQLTSLDVSRNTALTQLDCFQNQLATLDVSKNTALTSLKCFSNQLTSLDVSRNTALKNLDCDSNQLTSLDVSKNSALTHLYCSSNQLTTLDVTKNTALTHLHCSSNQLTILDVSENTALTYLQCSPMSSLKTLYVAPEQSIDGVTFNRKNGCVPYGTSIVTK